MRWGVRDRNAWTAVLLLAAAVDGVCSYMCFSSTSLSIATVPSWVPEPKYILGGALAVCSAIDSAPLLVFRTKVFSWLENNQNPTVQINRIVWFTAAYFVLSAGSFSGTDADTLIVAFTLVTLLGVALVWITQCMSKPLVSRNTYTTAVSLRLLPSALGWFASGGSMAVLLLNAPAANEDLTYMLLVSMLFDGAIYLFGVCGSTAAFYPAQYGSLLVLLSSQATMSLSATSAFVDMTNATVS